MLVVLISFLYIFIVCLCIGVASNKLLSRLIPVISLEKLGVTAAVINGFVVLTVYGEIFSIFGKVGALCHIIMLAATVGSAFFCKKEIKDLFISFNKSLCIPWRRIVYGLVILASAFFTSRGTYHTDTGIYHAQAIRIIEEYGLVKGIANLQLHFAYNSSYLVFCAMFTLSFVLPFALHTVTGFFMMVLSLHALKGMFSVGEHKTLGGDFARLGLLIYAFTEMVGLQSPATDYGTMFFVFYILVEWVSFFVEWKDVDVETSLAITGRLTVLSVFAVSMKLSAAAMVLLVIFPLYLIIKNKKWKELTTYLILGFVCILPYLVRNVLISGWLIYPVEFIDLFNVKWKVPVDYMLHDSAQIKVWGRCLYDVNKLNAPISEWLPIWWEEKQHYEEMLIYSQVLGVILLAALFIKRLKAKEIRFGMVVFYVTVFANLAIWFFEAPFIRYGLAFLLLLPLVTVGELIRIAVKKRSVALAIIIGIVGVNFFSWIDNYFTDNMVFIKHNLLANYYLLPEPFEKSQVEEVNLDGITVYYSPDEKNSYYYYPNSCVEYMIYRTKPMGDTVEDGFMPR